MSKLLKRKIFVGGLAILCGLLLFFWFTNIQKNSSMSGVKTAQMGGNSMYPLFSDKDTMKISTSVDKAALKHGDIVVFNINDPAYPAKTSVKRIIGVAGDKVKIAGGFVLLNGNKLDEPYLAKEGVTRGDKFLKEGVEYTIPPNELFVLGDDRLRSYDSRMGGFVKVDDVWAIVLAK